VEGGAARAYLKERGIAEATRRGFGFGLAPDSRGKLKGALKHFGNEKLVEAGLLIAPEEGKEPYDRFRGRLMFPIRDPRGRCIAFSGRIIGAGEPKYLNSPDTPLFDKGRSLFNIEKAAPASREAKRVIVVEGQMDVIALAQAGIAEAVAPLGTALTEGQLGLLWRLSPSPILCFDGDAAGQKAAIRAALRALPAVGPARSLGFVTLPPGQDPDDLLRAGGRLALDALLERPEPLVEKIWRHEVEAEPLRTPEQRAGLRRRLLDHVGAISDPDVREQYRFDLLERFNALTMTLGQRGPKERSLFKPNGYVRRPLGGLSPTTRVAASQQQVCKYALGVLRGLLKIPRVLATHGEAIATLPLPDTRAFSMREAMLAAAMEQGELDPERLNTILARQGLAPLEEVVRPQRGQSFSFTRRDADPERAERDLILVIETLATRVELDAALETATARLKDEGDEAAFREQQRLRIARDEADSELATLFEAGGD